jgi:diadenosine tetraphosphate (Ap4A) HIT family hydrolase
LNTLTKFRFPELLIKEYESWYLLLRFEQPTLGSLILITKHEETQYSEINKVSFIEFSKIVKEIEPILKSLFNYKKINYLMLMMSDPEVHYHIIPRYSENKIFQGSEFKDFGWPSLPLLNKINITSPSLERQLLKELIICFNNN